MIQIQLDQSPIPRRSGQHYNEPQLTDNGTEGSDSRGELTSAAFFRWVRATFSQEFDDISPAYDSQLPRMPDLAPR